MSKICRKCKIEKSVTEFHKDKGQKDGLYTICKLCNKQHRANTSEHIKEQRKQYRKDNLANHAANIAKRRAKKLLASPIWSETEAIRQLYIECEQISISTNTHREVDHIVPLQSDIVSGLHVLANLRIITSVENNSKGNRYWPDMW